MKIITTKNIKIIQKWLAGYDSLYFDKDTARHLTQEGTIDSPLSYNLVEEEISALIERFGNDELFKMSDDNSKDGYVYYRFKMPCEHNLSILTKRVMKHIEQQRKRDEI